MASRHRQVQFLAAAAIAVAFLPALASATDYVVGGEAGWTLNYAIGWPEGKIFKVGDNLVFNYTKGKHTVTEVDVQTFRDCYRHGNTINEWTSGNDTVKLDKNGTRWFFCSMADHCELGLKLVVKVKGLEAPSPTPPPTSPPGNHGSPQKPPLPPPPPDSTPSETSTSSSSAASTERRMTAVEAPVRAVVVMAAAAVAGCFI